MGIMDNIRYALEHARAFPAVLQLRPYTVTVVVRAWSGGRPGVGTMTETSTVLQEGGQGPRLESISTREIIASGGKYVDGDLGVGPFTPPYTDPIAGNPGGMDVSVLDPTLSAGSELLYVVDGPGLDHATCKKVELLRVDPLRLRLVLRRTGESGVT